MPRLWQYQSRDFPLKQPPAPPVLTPMGWEAVAQDRAPRRDRPADPGAVDFPLAAPPLPPAPQQSRETFPPSARRRESPTGGTDFSIFLKPAGAAPGWESVWFPPGPRKKPTDAGIVDFPLKQAPPSPLYIVTGFESTAPDRMGRRNAAEGASFWPPYPPFPATVQNPLGWQAHPEQPPTGQKHRGADSGASDLPPPAAGTPSGWGPAFPDARRPARASEGFGADVGASTPPVRPGTGWEAAGGDRARSPRPQSPANPDLPTNLPASPLPQPFGWEAVQQPAGRPKPRAGGETADLPIRAALVGYGWDAAAPDRTARRPVPAGDAGPAFSPPATVLTVPVGWDAVIPAGVKVRRAGDGSAVDAPTVRAAAAAWGWAADVPLTVRARRPAEGPAVELIVGPLLPWGWQTESPASAAFRRAAQGTADAQTAAVPVPIVNLEVFPTSPVHRPSSKGMSGG